MNPISSSDFKNNNQILFQTKIMQNVGWDFTANCGATHYRVGEFDVIDLNKNNKADSQYEKTGFTTYRQKFTEPSLVNDFTQLANYAKRYGAEVITQDDVNDLQVETGGISSGTTVFTKTQLIHENPHSISSLVSELEPFEKGAKWAIDVASGEFMIYKPK